MVILKNEPKENSGSDQSSPLFEKNKKDLVTILNKIEVQIRGIKSLIEKDSYCDDVINQISATQAALNGVVKLLLDSHVKTSVVEKLMKGDDEVIDDLLITIQKLIRK